MREEDKNCAPVSTRFQCICEYCFNVSSLMCTYKFTKSRNQARKFAKVAFKTKVRHAFLIVGLRPGNLSRTCLRFGRTLVTLFRVMVDGLVNGDLDGVRLDDRVGNVFLDRDGDRLLHWYRYVFLHWVRYLLLYRDCHRLHHLYRNMLRDGNVNGIRLGNADRDRMRHGDRY